MAIIGFVRHRKHNYRITKASQAIWINTSGDAIINLECILDVRSKVERPISDISLIVSSNSRLRDITSEEHVFRDEEFGKYLYDISYKMHPQNFIRLYTKPATEIINIASIKSITATFHGTYSRINIVFDRPLTVFQITKKGKIYNSFGFRISYSVPRFARKIKRHIYTESTWAISIRPFDKKIMGEFHKSEVLAQIKSMYYWLVLPRGYFVTSNAPEFDQIRELEVYPWRKIYSKLETDCLCYSWKVKFNNNGERLHMNYREPAFSVYWTLWAFVISVLALMPSLYPMNSLFVGWSFDNFTQILNSILISAVVFIIRILFNL